MLALGNTRISSAGLWLRGNIGLVKHTKGTKETAWRGSTESRQEDSGLSHLPERP